MTTSDDSLPGWLSISDLARERNVDKSAISRRVSRLEGRGVLNTRTHGKTKLVNLAEFDRAVAVTVDGIRELNGRGATGPPAVGAGPTGDDPVLAREQARRAAYDADLKRLDLEERLGRLVEVEAVRFNLEAIVVELVHVIDRLPSRAEALAAVLAKDGVNGLRAALRTVAREWREALAKASERFGDGQDHGEPETVSAAGEGVA